LVLVQEKLFLQLMAYSGRSNQEAPEMLLGETMRKFLKERI
jgi:hypothetical protein